MTRPIVLRPVGLGVLATVLAWIAVGVPIGVVAAARSPVWLDLMVLLLSPLPGMAGAWVAADQMRREAGSGLSAAAVGIATVVGTVVVVALLSSIGSGRSAVVPTIVLPLAGALVGAWLGGLRAATRR